jgi:tetratricopeptide (TPR) repeat protein
MNQNDYSSYESIDGLASSLPDGPERIALREKGINVADLTGDVRQQFEARKQFVEDVSNDGSFTEKYFVVFPWLLNYAKQHGKDDDKMIVLWYYKWVIGQMPEIPAVTKEQMKRALEDLRVRYLEYGSSEKVYHDYACSTYLSIGDNERSKYHQKQWSKFRDRDYLDDCEACVINRQVDFYCRIGTLENALKTGKPVLTGKLRCSHVPKTTYSHLLVPLMRESKEELSANYAEKLYKALMKKKYGGDNAYAHTAMIYFSKHGDFSRAIKLLERYMSLATEHKNLYRRFYFFVGALYMLKKLRKDTIKLKLSKKIPFYEARGTYNVPMLIKWFDEQTDAIAAQFDKRNKNDVISREKTVLLFL